MTTTKCPLSGFQSISGQATVNALKPGDRVYFHGRVYDAKATDGSVILSDTGIVSSRVVRAFERKADTLVDLTVRSADGKESVISGTPEHPFYVPASNGYVAMGSLTPGTVLKTADGTCVSVVQSILRHGTFAVYNFEVQGQHNYYVSNDGVLVHNNCGRKLSDGEIDALKKAGHDPHELKPDPASRYDLFKDRNGDIKVGPKSGIGPGDPVNLNINEIIISLRGR